MLKLPPPSQKKWLYKLCLLYHNLRASLVTQMVKNLPAMRKSWVWSLGWEDPLEEGMATHSSILAWRIPRTEEPGRLQSIESHRVRHDWRDLSHMPTPGWTSKKKSLLSWNSHSFHTNKYIMECKVVSSFQTHLTMSCLRYVYCFL